jgi:hypothetical protein
MQGAVKGPRGAQDIFSAGFYDVDCIQESVCVCALVLRLAHGV